MKTPTLHFLGATGTVTGSRFLLDYNNQHILIDCGLYQGLKSLRLRNWEPFPFNPRKIKAVILTHAHLDHSGWLPRLLREGFEGTIYATAPTRALCDVLLKDSAKIMEEEAEHASRHHWSKHKPALPLYTSLEAAAVQKHFRSVGWNEKIKVASGITLELRHAGHILGAAGAHLVWEGGSIFFSGDLGRTHDPLLPDPEPPPACDTLVIESTYGNRFHPTENVLGPLAEVLQRTFDRGGSVLIPSFAVGRTQNLLWQLDQLKKLGKLPPYPIWVDSPMASTVTGLYQMHCADHQLDFEECRRIFDLANYTESPEESRKLQASREKRIVISASGMATGGRVLWHLENMLSDPRNTILFAGFQAAGTRGADLVGGTPRLKLHGNWHAVSAEVVMLKGASAHADQNGLVEWMRQAPQAPNQVFIVHGEPEAADGLRRRVTDELQWNCVIPEYQQSYPLKAKTLPTP